VDFLGALEQDKSRLWFFATLFDSRIMGVPLDGGMGVLVGWGDNSDLVVTVGGFHPSFRPPALPFPVPQRLSVDLLNQPGRLIRVSGYFAVTSNTVQFGAKAELRLSFSHFSIEGHLGFDALFQFSPFAFAIDISAGVSLKAFGVGVFGIDLRFRLEGPAPYRAHGRGSIGFLFFEISANFDITWGESRVTTLPPVPVLPLLAGEIGKVEGWATRLPTGGGNPLVTLRQVGAAEGPVLHPLGTLFVRQRAIPLNVRVDRIGGQTATDGRRFGVALPLGSSLTPVSTTGDKFAMAQFQNMTDAQKLSRPSYEPQDAGVELTAKTGTLLASRVVRRSARYELHIIDSTAQPASGVLPPVTPQRFHDVHPAVFGELLRGSSTSRSPLSQREASLRQPFAAADTVQVTDQRFVVAYVRSNLQALPPATLNSTRQPLVAALTPTGTPATSFRSQTTAADALADWVGADPSLAGQLHVIPVAEAAAPPAEEGTWSPAGILPTPASGVDAVRLVSGRILMAGGADPTGAALAGTALYDPAGNAWSGAGPLGTARRGHTTGRLPDGGVLAAGGTGDAGVLASVERFEPAATAWAQVAPMGTARAGHSATVLTNGSVLVAGGTGTEGSALSTVELFDPVARTWSVGVPMTDARSGHQAVRLADGRVLVVGGVLPGGDGSGTALAYCELYDPATGTWSPTGSLTTARAGHQATLLPDGRVLVTGGEPVPAPDGTYSPHSLASAELYDLGTGTWSPAADMPGGRSRHRAVLVRTGVVLAIGGTRGPGFGGGYRSVFAYDPGADAWAATGALALGRADLAVAELADQRLLVAGGIATMDPVQPEAAATGEVLIP
jgi:hypothetical protein